MRSQTEPAVRAQQRRRDLVVGWLFFGLTAIAVTVLLLVLTGDPRRWYSPAGAALGSAITGRSSEGRMVVERGEVAKESGPAGALRPSGSGNPAGDLASSAIRHPPTLPSKTPASADGHVRWGKDRYAHEGLRQLTGALSQEECARIIELAVPRLTQSQVYSKDAEVTMNDVRQSSQCWLKPENDEALAKLSQLAEQLTGLPRENQEAIQIVKYLPGGYYKPHYDACDGDAALCARFTEDGGQRYATLLVYLNGGMRGGATRFPVLDLSIKPRAGAAVYFLNADADGKVIHESEHGGDPLEQGEKWIANVWVRFNAR
jgi:prolyl 4-hydroxylase